MLTVIFAIAVGAGVIYLGYSLILLWVTRVPSVATPTNVLKRIVDSVPITAETVLYDLGCGRGKFLFAAEKRGPKKLVGFEISPLHVWFARLKASLTDSRAKFVRGDFMKADISEATIIYLFLVPRIVEQAWKKIKAEAKPGTLVVTLADSISDATCLQTISLHPEREQSPLLYIYQTT